jgi:hypothetical protein
MNLIRLKCDKCGNVMTTTGPPQVGVVHAGGASAVKAPACGGTYVLMDHPVAVRMTGTLKSQASVIRRS